MDASILVSILLAVINVCVIMGMHLEQMNAVVKVKSIILKCYIHAWETWNIWSDVDECATANGGCQHNYTNIIGSYYCSCAPGYSPGW